MPPGSYDSLIAKIITWGDTRDEALDRMRRALTECVITGKIKTTIPFQLAMIDDPAFRSGNISIHYVADFLREWKEREATVSIA